MDTGEHVSRAWQQLWHVNCFDAFSWDIVVRAADPPDDIDASLDTKEVEIPRDCRRLTDVRVLNRKQPSHPLAFFCVLFPNSPVVAQVAIRYLEGGSADVARQLLSHAITRAGVFPSVWRCYVECLRRVSAPAGARVGALRLAVKAAGDDPRAGDLWMQLMTAELELLEGAPTSDLPARFAEFSVVVHAALRRPLLQDVLAFANRAWAAATSIRSRAFGASDNFDIDVLSRETFLAQRQRVNRQPIIPSDTLVVSPRDLPYLDALQESYTELIEFHRAQTIYLPGSEACAKVLQLQLQLLTSDARAEPSVAVDDLKRTLTDLSDAEADTFALKTMHDLRAKLCGETSGKLARSIRDFGKACVRARVTSAQTYQLWGETEKNELGDDKLLRDIAKRGLAAIDDAVRTSKQPRRGEAVLFAQSAAQWNLQLSDELEHLAALQRGLQISGHGALPLMLDAANTVVDSSLRLRGLKDVRATHERLTKDCQTLLAADEPLSSGVVAHHASMLWNMKSVGGDLPLNKVDLDSWRLFSDLRSSQVLRGELLAAKGHVVLADSVTPFTPAGEAIGWKSLQRLPLNLDPPRPTDDQNSDELCASRAMKPILKLCADPAAGARRLRNVQAQANPEYEVFGNQRSSGSAGDDDGRQGSTLARQLNTLVKICSGLPPVAAGAVDISVDWMVALLQQPLNLNASAAPRKVARPERGATKR